MLARKSIKQSYISSQELVVLMKQYAQMTNDAIRIGLANDNTSNMKMLCKLSYRSLKKYNVPSCYKICAISKAAGVISSRNKSIKRGYNTKNPHMKKPLLVSCYGFKISSGKLRIPLAKRKFEFIPLNKHTLKVLSDDKDLKVRSFTISEHSVSLCVAKEVPEMATTDITGMIGIDRNLRNLTAGNSEKVVYYDMNKLVKIGETTKEIVRSFKRNDVRIRKVISSKYGTRRKNRIQIIPNLVTKDIVQDAFESKKAIVFEDIKDIRNLYRKGNGQGHNFLGRMNTVPWGENKRQIEYKAQWKGVPVIHLTKKETRGTSSLCHICGERLQSSRDHSHERELWCNKCRKWYDRDYVAVMNISYRGWLRFAQSKNMNNKGIGREAMKGNPAPTVILRVDPMKLSSKVGGT